MRPSAPSLLYLLGRPMTDDAWENFIASIDPVALEHERMRVHGNLEHERPGSRQDHEMRHAHLWMKRDRQAVIDLVEDSVDAEIHRRQVADADLAIRQQRTTNPRKYDEQLEASIAAYRARKAA